MCRAVSINELRLVGNTYSGMYKHMYPYQGRRKRSGWSGFGQTNIEGESRCVHITAVCRRGCESDCHATLYHRLRVFIIYGCTKCKQRSFLQRNAWRTLILGQADVPVV